MTEGQGGQERKEYSEEDVEILLNETAKRAAIEALRTVKQNTQPNEETEDEIVGVSPKLVKQLQTTVGVFNTLKEFASNPLQRAIETKVGELAAGVIESAFRSPSGPPPKKDLIDTLLNSQFAFGLGNGLGQRGPELVESMGKTFGRDRAGDMIDGIIGQYGKGQKEQGGQPGRNRQLDTSRDSSSSSPPTSGPSHQSEKEILLGLDPNNPEHVAAYAESQGGISVDVARKMLMIHQDEFINQMKNQGTDVSQLSTARGSHLENQSQPKVVRQEVPISPQPPIKESAQPPKESLPGIEYTDFQDASPHTNYGQPSGQYQETDASTAPNTDPQTTGNQQMDVMKQFADDIGNVMGSMLNKIETLNNTVFILQGELGELKKRDISGIPHLDTLAESVPVPAYSGIKKSEDFFEEHITDAGSFIKELEGESAKKSEEDTKEKEEIEEKGIIESSTLQPLGQTDQLSIKNIYPIGEEQDIADTSQEEKQKEKESEKQEEKESEKQSEEKEEKESEKQSEEKEEKESEKQSEEKEKESEEKESERKINRFVTPIRTTGIQKIYTPSFKQSDIEDNKNTENIKET